MLMDPFAVMQEEPPPHLVRTDDALSSDHEALFGLDGVLYKSVAHCLAARRHAAEPELAARIRKAETAAEARALAGADARSQPEVLAECSAATLAKFQQNKGPLAALLATGSAFIVCIGPDAVWESPSPEAGADRGGGNAMGKVLMGVREELQEVASLEERRAGSMAHTLGAGLVALGLGIATAAGPPTDDQGHVIPSDGDDTAVSGLQAEIEVARMTRVEEDWATGVTAKGEAAEFNSNVDGVRDELSSHLEAARAAADAAAAAAAGGGSDDVAVPAAWRSVIAADFQWVDSAGGVAEGAAESARRLAGRWASQDADKWAVRAREITTRRFGLVCYELWEYIGTGAMDAAERDDVALLDPTLFAGGFGSYADSSDEEAVPEPAVEAIKQVAVEWSDGVKRVSRVTAVLRVAAPGAAEDYGGVEWVHRHETLVCADRSAGADASAAAGGREARAARLSVSVGDVVTVTGS